MNNSLTRLLQNLIDNDSKIKQWTDLTIFPLYLNELYKFYWMYVLEKECILVEPLDLVSGLDELKKHSQRISDITGLDVVFYFRDMSTFRRKSMIKNKVAFIADGGQIFLPFAALQLTGKATRTTDQKKIFTGNGQIAFLTFLYDRGLVINTAEYALKIGMTEMTASRALNELYKAGLVTYQIGGRTGRSKQYRRINDPEYFQRGKDYLKTPVSKIKWVNELPGNYLVAGYNALADQTMLNPMDHQIFAMSEAAFKEHKLRTIDDQDQIKDEKVIELEIWEYDPKLFSSSKWIDPASLYATLKNNQDERIQQALEELLEKETWYTASKNF